MLMEVMLNRDNYCNTLTLFFLIQVCCLVDMNTLTHTETRHFNFKTFPNGGLDRNRAIRTVLPPE